MAFIDEMKIKLSAGRGGDGVVRWRHEKGKDLGGPSGGDGGRGGDVYAMGVRDLGVLIRYRNKKEFSAERGEDGSGDCKKGANGKDFILEVPLGSVVTNIETGRVVETVNEGEKIMILHGGDWGFGNDHYKSSINRSPTKYTEGKDGEKGDFFVELQIMADAGLIGLPNAGKSSLLNFLTRAKAKVGSYQFTTLEPNLGEMYGYILADIPGLIEGASQGRGLGYKFLKHIKRTKVLLHCISLESDDISRDYKVIREELKRYSPDLVSKKEVIVLTKTDMIDEVKLKEQLKIAKKLNKDVLMVSVLDDMAMKKLTESIIDFIK
jgi:GTP-binding protein